jgi:hypothetical protein
MYRFKKMSVKSNEEVIPITDKLVDELFTNMTKYQLRKSRSRAEENKKLKSEIESLKHKLLANAEGTKMEEKVQKEGTQNEMKWCWFYDRNYGWDFTERSVEEKLATANTLFIPDTSIQLHSKVWNSLYFHIKASPEEVEEAK